MKTLNINDDLHKELKTTASMMGVTIQELAEQIVAEGLSNKEA